MVIRDGNDIAPTGNTVLKANDTVVIAAKNYRDEDIHLNELPMLEGDKWLGMEIRELNLSPDEKIVMIIRGQKIIIPSGNTVIKKGDALVMYHM